MADNKSKTGRWLFGVTLIIFIAIIALSGSIAWAKYRPEMPLEVSLQAEPAITGQVYIDGTVANPGLYPLREGDRLADLIRAAGGTLGDPVRYRLSVSSGAAEPGPQRVDINRAEAWLLEALPGIGPTRAQAIVAYRTGHGLFRYTGELLRVEGISTGIYEEIKDLVTVTDPSQG